MQTRKTLIGTCPILTPLAAGLLVMLVGCGNKGDLFLELDERAAEQIDAAEELIDGASEADVEGVDGDEENNRKNLPGAAPDTNRTKTEP